jgi:predicted acyl esterase
MTLQPSGRLQEHAPEFHSILMSGMKNPPRFGISAIRCESLQIAMRDGVRLMTDIYHPPLSPAPTIAMRTPYGRASDKHAAVFMTFARRGYVVVAQDCRGTGESEPDAWYYYVRELEDGFDLADWVARSAWFDGFLAGCGGSYSGQTQWAMATHPAVSAIAPEMSGLGFAINTARLHMFLQPYARAMGMGRRRQQGSQAELEKSMLKETLGGGYFNEPLGLPRKNGHQFRRL